MFKLWYGGDRRTVIRLMSMGACVRHVDPNVIEVSNIDAYRLRHVRGILSLDVPRTSVEAAFIEAASVKGYLKHA